MMGAQEGDAVEKDVVEVRELSADECQTRFNEIAPKYAQRKEEVGQGGGYTRIYLLGERRGDGAEEAIIELV